MVNPNFTLSPLRKVYSEEPDEEPCAVEGREEDRAGALEEGEISEISEEGEIIEDTLLYGGEPQRRSGEHRQNPVSAMSYASTPLSRSAARLQSQQSRSYGDRQENEPSVDRTPRGWTAPPSATAGGNNQTIGLQGAESGMRTASSKRERAPEMAEGSRKRQRLEPAAVSESQKRRAREADEVDYGEDRKRLRSESSGLEHGSRNYGSHAPRQPLFLPNRDRGSYSRERHRGETRAERTSGAGSGLNIKDLSLNLKAELNEALPQKKSVLRSESAKQYLNSQVGFRTKDLDGYAGLCNEWSTYIQDTDCREACEKVAQQLAASPKLQNMVQPLTLALLANAFSKLDVNDKNSSARNALEWIAEKVQSRQGYGYEAQHFANLANAFSKLDVNDKNSSARNALEWIAEKVQSRQGYGYEAQHLANLANAFSKLDVNNNEKGRKALEWIAGKVQGRQDYSAQSLAMLANAFSKLDVNDKNSKARNALEWIAGKVQGRQDYSAQGWSNLANAFSKLDVNDKNSKVRNALEWIAGGVVNNNQLNWNSQELANLANAFSKLDVNDKNSKARNALEWIAGGVVNNNQLNWNSQELAMLANAFSKLDVNDKSSKARNALEWIAGKVQDRQGYSAQNFANLANAFSKLDVKNNEEARNALEWIAEKVVNNNQLNWNSQELANLANAFSKLDVNDKNSKARNALEWIAGGVVNNNQLNWNSQELAMLANAFSKLDVNDKSSKARNALEWIAGKVQDRQDYSAQNLANLANAFGKLDVKNNEEARNALEWIAEKVVNNNQLNWNSQELANLANAFSKLDVNDKNSKARNALEWIAEKVGVGERGWWGNFDMAGLSQMANALSRGWMAAEGEGQALFADRLHRLADHLAEDSNRLKQAETRVIATIFKALGKVQLYRDLGVVAADGMERLEELRAENGLTRDNLEMVGNLCVGLLPLARSPQLRRHRKQVLEFLQTLRPVVERKLRLYREHTSAAPSGSAGQLHANPEEQWGTRRPALTVYQVLKTYQLVENLSRRQKREKADEGGREEAWLLQTLAQNRELIEQDLGSRSWNLIAQLEAENPLDALDQWLERLEQTQKTGEPTQFDFGGVLEQMQQHEPQAPPDGVGMFRMDKVDLRGTASPAPAGEERYSILSRLTESKLRPVGVQLPGQLSAFMLARMVHVDGVPYRMDLFGGSAMKSEAQTLGRIFAQEPGQDGAKRDALAGGRLLAIPLAETKPESPFAGLVKKLLPYKESFYYFQRMMIASPPGGIENLKAQDYVLEGRFPIAILPDRKAGELHPFQLKTRAGHPIALRPHDGTGFIKESVGRKMGLFQKTDTDKLPMFGNNPAKLPAQALQHYPRNQEVAAEAKDKLKPSLVAEKPLQGEALFRSLTAGNIEGQHAVAIPSADGKLYLPRQKRATQSGTNAGVLVGRSPYDKPNLRPIEASRVVGEEDATARFLSECMTIQYSFVAAEHDPSEQPTSAQRFNDANLFFAKGLLVLVPDAMWPKEYSDRSVVLSAEDIKTHSTWTTQKDRRNQDASIDCTGILQATEVFGPGSLVAVPIGEQKKLDGDFDGDSLILLSDRPALFDHVQAFEEKEQKKKLASLKPPKSHTSAIRKDDSYEFGRGRQILSTMKGTLQSYTGLLQTYLAQPEATRKWIAERAVFGTYEGLDSQFKQQLRDALEQEEKPEQLEAQLEEQLRAARSDVAKQMMQLLQKEVQAWMAEPPVDPPETGEASAPALSDGPLMTTGLEKQKEMEDPDNAQPESKPDAKLLELFPGFKDYYKSRIPSERIEAILNAYPNRMEVSLPDYDPEEPQQSLQNFLSLGIKIGTDAYKSDTGAYAFTRKADRLRSLLAQAPDLKTVPYAKSTARRLHSGKLNVENDREQLKENPTLAAEVMEACLDLGMRHNLLEPPHEAASAKRPPTEAASSASELYQRAKKEEPAITPLIKGVARQSGAELKDIEKILRSSDSMKDQLQSASSKDGAQLLSNALRYVLVFPEQDFSSKYTEAMRALQASGFTKMNAKNYFLDQEPTFLGVQVVLANSEGYHFTIQFHTPESYQAKTDNHDTYKQYQRAIRKTHPDTKETDKLLTRMRERNKPEQVPLPPDAKRIRNFLASLPF
jgi:hypothetical protein